MKFNHLNVPSHWKNYWTRYPEGHTILEALISWVSQVDSMVDNQNKLNDNVAQFRNELDVFVGRFDERLQDEVTRTLNDWQDSGFLEVVISSALQWELDDYKATNEQDKLSINQQLAQVATRTGDTISSGEFGIIGNGTDETEKFQDLLNAGVGKNIVMLPFQNKLKIGKINVPSDITIDFPKNALVEVTTGLPDGEVWFDMTNQQNITINGNNTKLKMLKSEYTTGEHRHAFNLNGGCHNITFNDLIVDGSGGDGFYVGNRDTSNLLPNTNITLKNCVSTNNRRQGLSITNAKNFLAVDCLFEKTSGTAPQAGVDIEPNRPTDLIEHITFERCHFENNARAGIEIMLQSLSSSSNPISITMKDCFSTGNLYGYYIRYATEGLRGHITIINSRSENEKGCGFYEWNVASNELVKSIGLAVVNANSGNHSSVEYGSAASFFIRSGGTTTQHGETIFNQPISIETRGTKTVTRDFYFLSENESIINAKIYHPQYNERLRFTGVEEKVNVGVIQSAIEQDEINITTNTNGSYTNLGLAHIGKVITNTGATSNISFRLRKGNTNITYDFLVTDDTFIYSIQSYLGYKILGFEDHILRGSKGARLTIKGRSDGSYDIVDMSGTWTPATP